MWPGTHKLLHTAKVGRHGQIDVLKLQESLNEHPFIPCEDLSPKFGQNITNISSRPSLGPPFQVHMKAGDIVMLHPDLAHNGGPNTLSPDIRRVVYFRLRQLAICTCTCKDRSAYISTLSKSNISKFKSNATDTDKTNNSIPNSKSNQRNDYRCCNSCGCDCRNSYSSWEELCYECRSDMWADLKGVQKFVATLNDTFSP